VKISKDFFSSEINTFHLSYVESKNLLRVKKQIRLSRAIAIHRNLATNAA
jgi:hypothetical protein